VSDDPGRHPTGEDRPRADPVPTTPSGVVPDPRPPFQTPPPSRPGASVFTIEGRAAPGLFVVGWLASILGLGITLIGLLSGGAPAASWLFIAGLLILGVGLVAGAGAQALERRATGRSDYTGPSPVLGFLVSVPLTLLAAIAVLGPLAAMGLDLLSPLASLLSVSITALVYVVVLRLLVVGTRALTWSELGVRPPRAATVREVGWGAVLGVAILFPTGLLAALLARFWTVPPDVLPPAVDATGLIVNLLAAAVVAPIGEELFFRGFVTTAWLRTDGERAAIARGAVLFAGAHILTTSATSAGEGFEQAAFAFVVRLPVAIALGWLYVRTRSLYGPVVLHAVFNGIQVLAVASQAAPA
jgi:uncharacterized protein